MIAQPHDPQTDAVLRSLGLRTENVEMLNGPLGRIAIVHGAQAEVIWADELGTERTTTLELPESLPGTLVAGDWVSVNGGRISAVLPRRTELRRPRRRSGEMQVLAANIDLVLIVTPVDRPPNIPLLERLVVMAWDSGAEPMIVLSKADETTDALRYRQEIGVAVPDIDVVTTSAISGWGIDRLREKLKPGVTAVMLGASGAGKTSLLNSLEGSHHRTRSVSRSGEGRHATTTRRLHRLGSGGVLLDIPGIRLVDFKIDRATLDGVFGDIGDLAIECRFRDCAHASEHGCAVVAAVDEGYLALSRLELWRSLMNELTDNQVAQRPRTRRRLSKSDERMRRSDDEEMAD